MSATPRPQQPPLHQLVALLDLVKRTESEAVRLLALQFAREAQARLARPSPKYN